MIMSTGDINDEQDTRVEKPHDPRLVKIVYETNAKLRA